ncbi:MAG TPA: nicotinate phosphoribosyltransferase [Clostridiales bacterium]|nr:nicotinate phosphoribosyltransferase [Clostridiales bacterium]
MTNIDYTTERIKTNNLTLLTDLYQLTMMNGYRRCKLDERRAVFDIFYRGSGGYSYAIAAGLEQAIDYILNLHFDDSDIAYLRSLEIFDEDFLKALETFEFTGDIKAVPEGTMVFPYEPILTVSAPLWQAQLVETALLTFVNHQTLIATKAARLKECTKNKISEFGLRRAQGPDAGIYGARAACIGGCRTTSNVVAGKLFGIPVTGTHSHSWVMSFDTELEAFEKYAEIYPDNCLLLVDTYDTLKSGVPNAIKVFDKLKAQGHKPVGIRLDSGDLAYLSRKARVMLDEAGHEDCLIFATNDLDEDILLALNSQDAKIDVYGIGTKLITSYNNASLGGVYKLCALEEDGNLVPKIKVSNSHEKTTNPGVKKIVRIYKDGMAQADLICLEDETFDTSKPLTIFHPEQTWKKTTFTDYELKELMVPVFKDGKLVYDMPTLKEICDREDKSIASFFPEYRRVVNTQEYKVDLSQKLWDLKHKLLNSEH